jgi:hypothetical protein
MLPDDPIVVLRLDRAARREHDQRRLAVAFASHTPLAWTPNYSHDTCTVNFLAASASFSVNATSRTSSN